MSAVNYNINFTKQEHKREMMKLIESEKEHIKDCDERLVAVQFHNLLPSMGDNVRVIQITKNGNIKKNVLFEDDKYEEEHIKMSKKLAKKNLKLMIYIHNCDIPNSERMFEKLKNFQGEMLEYVEEHHSRGEQTLTTEITDGGRVIEHHKEEGAILAFGNALMKRRDMFEKLIIALKYNYNLIR
jgi:hypothetical protein